MRSWLIQRISAVFIVLFIAYVTLSIGLLETEMGTYTQWHGWVSLGLNRVLLLLFFLALLLHAWVGIRDVVLDYVHGFKLRFFLLTAIIGGLLALALWLLLIMIRV